MLLLQQRIFDRKDYETGGMIIMIKRYKWTLFAASLMILCPIIVGIIFWDQLPDMIPTHFGSDNQVKRMDQQACSCIWNAVIFTCYGIFLRIYGRRRSET